MRKSLFAFALVAAVMASSPVFAGPGCDQSAHAKKSGCSKTSADKCDKGALAALPKMHYKVGDFETCCYETAKKKAGEKETVHYLVGGESFDCRTEASAKLASMLEKDLEKMMEVQYSVAGECVGCPMAAKQLASEKHAQVKYRLAGVDFDSKDEAEKAGESVHAAVVAYAKEHGIDGCPIKGGEKSGCAGAKMASDSSKSGCDKPCDKPCGSKATKVAGKDKKGCDKPCDKPCDSKATKVAGKDKAGCCAKGAKTVAGKDKAGCCAKDGKQCPKAGAEDRVAMLMDVARVMHEAANGKS